MTLHFYKKYFPYLIFLLLPVNLFGEEKEKGWETPEINEQIERDGTLIPVGKGAIFVPSMYDPDIEPQYRVIQNDQVVTETFMGKRAIVDPGEYEVLIGSKPLIIRKKAEVLESRTTVIEPDWSELLLNVVDERSIPVRGSYEILSLPSREYVGIGLGAEIEEGEFLKPWILPPGTYMIIKIGEDYHARKNFFTFELHKGHLEHLTLVIDSSTGDFLGAGAVMLGEARTGVENWLVSMLLSGDLEFINKDNVFGSASGNYISLSGFLDTIATYRGDKNHFYLRFRVEEGQRKEPDNKYQKTFDELKFDNLYIYRFVPWFGPYLRFGVETPILEGYEYFSKETDVQFFDTDGSLITEEKNVKKTKVSTFFAPLTIKGGCGTNFSLMNLQFFNLSTRLGPGFRKVFTGSLFTRADDAETDQIEMKKKDDYHQFGLEWIVVTYLGIGRYVTVNTEFEVFSPFDDYQQYNFDLENTIAFRLTSFASLNYILNRNRDYELSSNSQIEHRLVLRFSWKIF